MPGLIWASAENSVSFLKPVTTNEFTSASQPALSMVAAIPAIQGFYGVRGVVTFNGRVFDKDYIFVRGKHRHVDFD